MEDIPTLAWLVKSPGWYDECWHQLDEKLYQCARHDHLRIPLDYLNAHHR